MSAQLILVLDDHSFVHQHNSQTLAMCRALGTVRVTASPSLHELLGWSQVVTHQCSGMCTLGGPQSRFLLGTQSTLTRTSIFLVIGGK